MGSGRWLIVGLGNPGPAYSHNRHNVGYWTINRLARLHGIALKARRLATLGEGRIGDSEVTLVKPRTFVNDSGHAVAAARKHTRVGPENVLVVYDELDLPAGRLRMKAKGGTAGRMRRQLGRGPHPSTKLNTLWASFSPITSSPSRASHR